MNFIDNNVAKVITAELCELVGLPQRVFGGKEYVCLRDVFLNLPRQDAMFHRRPCPLIGADALREDIEAMNAEQSAATNSLRVECRKDGLASSGRHDNDALLPMLGRAAEVESGKSFALKLSGVEVVG